MSKVITYRGTDPFVGQATPFISKGVEYVQVGERWAQVEQWTLNGIITGCDFTALNNSRLQLLGNFSNAFGEMNIATGTFILNPVEIKSVDIEDSDWIGGLPYTISFSYYPSGSFTGVNHSGFYGVIDPVDNITYNEMENGIVEVQRQISAKGLLTVSTDKDSALKNAKAFIDSRKSIFVKPFLVINQVTSGVIENMYLVSSDESYNRIANEVSLNQTYRSDSLDASGDIIHRYTIDSQEAASQPIQVTYNGEINAGKYAVRGITGCREKYHDFKSGIGFPYLLNEEITEDLYINKLNYSLAFLSGASGNNLPQVRDDITINIDENSDSSLFNATVNGAVGVNYGCLSGRLELVSGHLDLISQANYHFPLVQAIYEDFYTTNAGSKQAKPTNIYLNPVPMGRSKEVDQNENTASYNASYNDRFIPVDFSGCTSFDAQVSMTHAIYQRAIKENYQGGYYIAQNIGANSRENVGVSLDRQGVTEFAGTGKLNDFAVTVLNNFRKDDATKEYFEEPSYNSGSSPRSESFSVGKSYNTLQHFESQAGYTP